jgi:hypothetical protein
MSGCFGLGKASNAITPTTEMTQFVMNLDRQSSLARSSGQATRARLVALFPSAANTVLDPVDFGFQGATGINQTFGQESRPYDSLAQSALRGKASALCKDSVDDPQTTLFRMGADQLLAGETAPTDEAQRVVLGALRNAWLHPYGLNDPETRHLVAFYSQVASSSGSEGGAAGARRAVCMSVLLAPQFWMGTPHPTDPVRRISLEFFQRVPKMQELADYAAGKFTSTQYFDRLYADASLKEGFLDTVKEWHHEWLGLRSFIPRDTVNMDRRPYFRSSNMAGASSVMGVPFTTGRLPSGANATVLAPFAMAGLTATGCTSDAVNQEFDPDTSMIAWQHYNYDLGGYDFVGGWLRTGAQLSAADSSVVRPNYTLSLMGYNTAADRIAQLDLMPFPSTASRRVAMADLCRQANAAFATTDQEGVVWRRCNGLLRLNAAAAGRLTGTLRRLLETIRLNHGYSISGASSDIMRYRCPTGAATCIENFQRSYRSSRDKQIEDFKNLALRIRAYTDTALVQDTGLHSLLINNFVPGQWGAFFDNFITPVATTDPTKADQLVEAFGPAIAAAPPAGRSGWHYETDIAHIVNPTVAGFNPTLRLQMYTYGGTQIEKFSNQLGNDTGNGITPAVEPTVLNGKRGFSQAARRVVRLGGTTGTWQNGYSPIKLWWTGGTVPVCNNADRLWATCFYRPLNVRVPKELVARYNASRGNFWDDITVDSAMHPATASAFYCGKPAPSAINTVAQSLGNSAYSPVKFGPGPSNLNDVGTGVDLSSTVTTGSVGTEVAVFNEVATQLANEPYQLIEGLIADNKDYRELLTANYTHGNACFKFFYDTQGFALPTHPDAAGQACRGPGESTQTVIRPGPGIPIGHITAVDGVYQGDTVQRRAMWNKIYRDNVGQAPTSLPPRVYSGILTMPAFVAPVATTTRGIASRVFQRLLCDQANFYDPVADKAHPAALPMHTSFVSRRKHLKQECFQCHRNLDPMASALSWTYLGLLVPDPNDPGFYTHSSKGGEGGVLDYLGELDAVDAKGALPGLRHGGAAPSAGAFMGTPVNGIRELAQAVADSDKFASCVTSTVFSRVFGRQVQFADGTLYKQLLNDFKNPQKANYRYVELLRLMIGSDSFTRKN